MGSSILSEVDDTSILRTGLSTCYWRPLGRLPASRLLPPRSGLERSDFVQWPSATDFSLGPDVSFRGEAEVGRATESAASVESDRAAKLTAIPAGESPANRGVQSLL